MTDIRAQRALRAHLEAIDMINRRRAQRDQEMQRKREKVYQKTLQIEAKKKQRLQVLRQSQLCHDMHISMPCIKEVDVCIATYSVCVFST